MSVKLTLVDGVLYSESGQVVTILQNELADQENLCENQEVEKTNTETTVNELCYFKPLSQQTADEDNTKLLQWLEEAGLPNVFPYLKDAKITFDSLQFLDRDAIKQAIPPIGIRAKFRNKLFAWRKEKFGIEDDADSLKSEIRRWMQDSSLNSTPSSTPPVGEVSHSNG